MGNKHENISVSAGMLTWLPTGKIACIREVASHKPSEISWPKGGRDFGDHNPAGTAERETAEERSIVTVATAFVGLYEHPTKRHKKIAAFGGEFVRYLVDSPGQALEPADSSPEELEAFYDQGLLRGSFVIDAMRDWLEMEGKPIQIKASEVTWENVLSFERVAA